jgi:hypothetical protein
MIVQIDYRLMTCAIGVRSLGCSFLNFAILLVAEYASNRSPGGERVQQLDAFGPIRIDILDAWS